MNTRKSRMSTNLQGRELKQETNPKKQVASFFGVASGSKIVVMKHFDQEKLSMHVFSFTKKEDIEAFVRGASKKMYLEIGTDEAADVLSARPVREGEGGGRRVGARNKR